jgi:molecular chaperone HscB
MNYFEFYKIPLSFSVDESFLRRSYLQNSKKYHPDFHTLSDSAQQDAMLELSTFNNEAFKTLGDPDRRIRYVLELKGLLGDESKLPALPPDFLMDMMDINESIMELEFDFDATRYKQTLQTLEKKEQELEADLAPVLEQWTDTPEKQGGLEKIKEFYLKKRYLLRIRENLSKFAPAFGQ